MDGLKEQLRTERQRVRERKTGMACACWRLSLSNPLLKHQRTTVLPLNTLVYIRMH